MVYQTAAPHISLVWNEVLLNQPQASLLVKLLWISVHFRIVYKLGVTEAQGNQESNLTLHQSEVVPCLDIGYCLNFLARDEVAHNFLGLSVPPLGHLGVTRQFVPEDLLYFCSKSPIIPVFFRPKIRARPGIDPFQAIQIIACHELNALDLYNKSYRGTYEGQCPHWNLFTQ